MSKGSTPPTLLQPGTTDAPWMCLTDRELHGIRQRMKKSSSYAPSLDVVRKELSDRGRGYDNYLAAKARAKAAGENFIDRGKIKSKPPGKNLIAGEISVEAWVPDDQIRRNSKINQALNNAKQRKREAQAGTCTGDASYSDANTPQSVASIKPILGPEHRVTRRQAPRSNSPVQTLPRPSRILRAGRVPEAVSAPLETPAKRTRAPVQKEPLPKTTGLRSASRVKAPMQISKNSGRAPKPQRLVLSQPRLPVTARVGTSDQPHLRPGRAARRPEIVAEQAEPLPRIFERPNHAAKRQKRVREEIRLAEEPLHREQFASLESPSKLRQVFSRDRQRSVDLLEVLDFAFAAVKSDLAPTTSDTGSMSMDLGQTDSETEIEEGKPRTGEIRIGTEKGKEIAEPDSLTLQYKEPRIEVNMERTDAAVPDAYSTTTAPPTHQNARAPSTAIPAHRSRLHATAQPSIDPPAQRNHHSPPPKSRSSSSKFCPSSEMYSPSSIPDSRPDRPPPTKAERKRFKIPRLMVGKECWEREEGIRRHGLR